LTEFHVVLTSLIIQSLMKKLEIKYVLHMTMNKTKHGEILNAKKTKQDYSFVRASIVKWIKIAPKAKFVTTKNVYKLVTTLPFVEKQKNVKNLVCFLKENNLVVFQAETAVLKLNNVTNIKLST